ncbi:ankyrin [Parathielavia appendiculata]|uniref:Ankyrin n=1 Tax=Parathielavia appendiculata TaxID=2587402 RepID=A0AAN6Z7B1_9PEZI|nr:ankyrin [Parathielavia appendiculata]
MALIGNREVVSEVGVADFEGNTALHRAVICPDSIAFGMARLVNGQEQAVLIATNSMSEPALHVPARWNVSEAIEPLIDAGADLDIHRSWDGATPIHVAVQHGSYEFVNRLCSLNLPLLNAVVAANNDGNNALHLAAERGDSKMLEAVLSLYSKIVIDEGLGPDDVQVAEANNKGEAAAELAAAHGHVDFTLRVLKAGRSESEAARSRHRKAAITIAPHLYDTSAPA